RPRRLPRRPRRARLRSGRPPLRPPRRQGPGHGPRPHRPVCHRAVLTTPASPRALPPAELAAYLPADLPAIVEPDPAAALDRALALGGGPLVACGSIFLIGDVGRMLRERFGVPEAAEAMATG